MGKGFNIDETDLNIGPLVKADACFEAGIASLRAGERPAAEKLLMRGMQLYDMAGRPDLVLKCAKELDIASPELYGQAAAYFFNIGDNQTASRIVREHGLVELVEKFSEQYLVE